MALAIRSGTPPIRRAGRGNSDPAADSPTEGAVQVIGTGKAVPDLLALCKYPLQQALDGKYGA